MVLLYYLYYGTLFDFLSVSVASCCSRVQCCSRGWLIMYTMYARRRTNGRGGTYYRTFKGLLDSRTNNERGLGRNRGGRWRGAGRCCRRRVVRTWVV